MPIMIPTGAEIERMNHRTRVVLAKRLRAIRRELAESLATLAINGLDVFPSRRAVTRNPLVWIREAVAAIRNEVK